MLQNSLDRIFEGLARALRDDVLPAVSDPYARAQVLAGAELIANLAPRVEWRSAELEEEIDRVRTLLAAAADRPVILDEEVPRENAALVASHHAHLEELARALEAGNVPEEPLRAYLAWQLERDLVRLRTGMYKG
jgi:hypothetical protein